MCFSLTIIISLIYTPTDISQKLCAKSKSGSSMYTLSSINKLVSTDQWICAICGAFVNMITSTETIKLIRDGDGGGMNYVHIATLSPPE